MWKDFLAGRYKESVEWLSAFVGLYLIKSGINKTKLEITAQTIAIRHSKKYGYGYNRSFIEDADSTAFVILFLQEFGYKRIVQKAKGFVKKHQYQDGGYSTYLEKLVKKPLNRYGEDFSGWCMPCEDVTASVLQAIPDDDDAITYLKKQQKNNHWKTYWWTSDIYTTNQAIKALKKEDNSEAQEWLSKQKTNSAAYKAMIIESIIENRDCEKITENYIKQLISSQNIDGSWESSELLLMPHPSNKNLQKDKNHILKPVKDQNRIFTTAVCIKALNNYRKAE